MGEPVPGERGGRNVSVGAGCGQSRLAADVADNNRGNNSGGDSSGSNRGGGALSQTSLMNAVGVESPMRPMIPTGDEAYGCADDASISGAHTAVELRCTLSPRATMTTSAVTSSGSPYVAVFSTYTRKSAGPSSTIANGSMSSLPVVNARTSAGFTSSLHTICDARRAG